tara:strand:- start:2877 stop:3260 length:384 start_codon:yes stop_codon:yes gene_type:complete
MQVLVVDDKQVILDSLSKLLIAHGHFVDTANHGLAASEKLQTSDYDLLIIDHLMPIMNGIKLTKLVRQNQCYANVPVIFMTTQGQKSIEMHCNTDIFSAIIDKPIDEQQLVKLINELISSNTRYQLL